MHVQLDGPTTAAAAAVLSSSTGSSMIQHCVIYQAYLIAVLLVAQVIGTAVVYPDVPEQQPIRQAAAAANITVTCAGSLMDTPSPSGTPAGGTF